MGNLHAFDPSIADLGVIYDPENCWFCTKSATVPMRFEGEDYDLLYNACADCARLTEDPDFYSFTGIYLLCNDEIHEEHRTL